MQQRIRRARAVGRDRAHERARIAVIRHRREIESAPLVIARRRCAVVAAPAERLGRPRHGQYAARHVQRAAVHRPRRRRQLHAHRRHAALFILRGGRRADHGHRPHHVIVAHIPGRNAHAQLGEPDPGRQHAGDHILICAAVGIYLRIGAETGVIAHRRDKQIETCIRGRLRIERAQRIPHVGRNVVVHRRVKPRVRGRRAVERQRAVVGHRHRDAADGLRGEHRQKVAPGPRNLNARQPGNAAHIGR